MAALSSARRLLARIVKSGRRGNILRLHPKESPAGRAILSFGTGLYERLARGERPLLEHPAAWSNFVLARSLLDRGLVVDVLNWNDSASEPEGGADIVIDVAQNLERLAPLAGRNAPLVLYPMFANPDVHNRLSRDRYEALRHRRGISLRPTKLVRRTGSIELATDVLFPGGEFSLAGFTGFSARVERVPQARPFEKAQRIVQSVGDRKTCFLWLGGFGAVHKGLDVTLEAFASLPHLRLLICADLEREAEFGHVYQRELSQLPNIEYHGFVDTCSDQWLTLVRRCAGFLSTSCCEVRVTAALACMRSGLVPILSNGSDIDAPAAGVTIGDLSVEGIQEAVSRFAGFSDEEILLRSNAARAEVETLSGRSSYVAAVDNVIERIVGRPRTRAPLSDWTEIHGIDRIAPQDGWQLSRAIERAAQGIERRSGTRR